MGNYTAAINDPRPFAEPAPRNESHSSGVSWGAVIGGAFVAAALSLILLALGAGLGLSSVSPWSNVGASAGTVGKAAIIWLILIEIIASAMGGYLTGRLRTKWAAIHNDEVYFRDTANGFLAWAVALVLTVSFLTAAAASMVGTSPSSGGAMAEGVMATGAAAEGAAGPNQYFVDMLFRTDRPASAEDASMKRQASVILVAALRQNDLTQADRTYLGQLVVARTGLSQQDAERRVADVVASARLSADAARKAAAHLLLWTFLALLIGAFCASFAATIGGRQRDHVKVV